MRKFPTLFEARTGRGPEDFPEHGAPLSGTPLETDRTDRQKEACSWNSLTWENAFLDEKDPHVKGRSLHT
jgi:hypothetical protein